MREILELLNSKKIEQDAYLDDLLLEVKELEGFYILKEDLDQNEHRWYTVALGVLRRDDETIGVKYICQIHSESMGISDVGWKLRFCEVEEVTEVTYREIANK